MPVPEDLDRRIEAIAALDQPLRRRLHRLLADQQGWVTRDDAAEALAVPRSVVAFHLDKLAEVGLAEVGFERVSGRTGPGAGLPAKLYRLRGDEVSASVPPRHYDLAGSLLATAVAEATATGRPVAECLHAAARSSGHVIGEEARAAEAASGPSAVVEVLARHGYEPQVGPDGVIALANCPFHRLAEQHRSLVCGMNQDFLSGLLEGMGPDADLTARLEPEPGWCCVRISGSGG